MTTSGPRPSSRRGNRRLWLSYAGTCALAWCLFVLAGSEFDRGLDPFWLAVYQATTMLWAPMLLGVAVWPLARRLHASEAGPAATGLAHALVALAFAALWQAGEFGVNAALFGANHAGAVLLAGLLWRSVWGLVVYAAIATAFTAVLQSRAARAAAVTAAQAESALAKAELSAISGKLNPHFLFNTLNTLIALTRKDPAGAEAALLQFASMLRYVLDTKRGAEDRVLLADEIDFLRDYLALEALRLGPRLRVDWQLEERVLADELPPLTLQPLVENSILHAVAPRKGGGCVTITARRNALNQGLDLAVADDGPGCEPEALEPKPGQHRGVGLAALRKRFALDYEGQARLRIHTAPRRGISRRLVYSADMNTITVLIAEDEPLAAEALADWVRASPGLQLVAVCMDGEDALAQIRAQKPALVLTDIQMPGLTGLQVVQALQGDAHQPRIIFTTAYDQHALTAFELHAVDYLLKPFSRERFDEAVAHALRDAAPSNAEVAQALGAPADAPLTRLLVRDQGKIFPLQVDAIECLRSDNKYTAIASKGRSFLVRLPIADFEARLDPARFLRVQRGCIINLDFVDSMTPDENSQLVVQLRDGTRITANREVSKMLREQSL